MQSTVDSGRSTLAARAPGLEKKQWQFKRQMATKGIVYREIIGSLVKFLLLQNAWDFIAPLEAMRI
jgi:hypothetical protein